MTELAKVMTERQEANHAVQKDPSLKEIIEKQGELVRLLLQLVVLECQKLQNAPKELTYWKGIIEAPGMKYLITIQHVEGHKIPLGLTPEEEGKNASTTP